MCVVWQDFCTKACVRGHSDMSWKSRRGILLFARPPFWQALQEIFGIVRLWQGVGRIKEAFEPIYWWVCGIATGICSWESTEEAALSCGEWFSLDPFNCKPLFIISGRNEYHLCQRKPLNQEEKHLVCFFENITGTNQMWAHGELGCNGTQLLNLQVGMYLLVRRIPAKATKLLKSHLVTSYLIGNQKREMRRQRY